LALEGQILSRFRKVSMRNRIPGISALLLLPLAGLPAMAARTFKNLSSHPVQVMLITAEPGIEAFAIEINNGRWLHGMSPQAWGRDRPAAPDAPAETPVLEFKDEPAKPVLKAEAPGPWGFWNHGIVLAPGGSIVFDTARKAMAAGARDELVLKVVPGAAKDPVARAFAPDGLRLGYTVAPGKDGTASDELSHRLTPSKDPDEALPFRVLEADDTDPGLRLADPVPPAPCCVVM
jgi:hypothetical protein